MRQFDEPSASAKAAGKQRYRDDPEADLEAGGDSNQEFERMQQSVRCAPSS
jgi:hypothetical protein